MAPELDVDPKVIKRGGEGIHSAAQHLRSEWQAFQGELQGHGEPWGGDMIGMLIGGCYGAIYEAAVECIESNIDGLKDYADGTVEMASVYFQAEDRSTVEVNRVRQMLG
ncbi:hypothetical protein [Actinomadura kijaniata]|uniref:hypothetical protein n=1 Tax=Actinomadura kijaniata TaxID=46161 RepID=UPI000829EC10|nr:hypothetical protein [Actinomadura kijaniata]